MLPFVIALMLAADPISAAMESYAEVETYGVTLRSGMEEVTEVIKYYYKKPGFIRMEFIKPYQGALLVYSPETGKVRLRPFGFLKPFVLTLSPKSGLIKSSRGHRVDESDIGALLKNVRLLQKAGKAEPAGEDTVGGRKAEIIKVEGDEDITVDDIHRYVIWFDTGTRLPLKVQAYGPGGDLIEEVLMDDLEINIKLPDDFFGL